MKIWHAFSSCEYNWIYSPFVLTSITIDTEVFHFFIIIKWENVISSSLVCTLRKWKDKWKEGHCSIKFCEDFFEKSLKARGNCNAFPDSGIKPFSQ